LGIAIHAERPRLRQLVDTVTAAEKADAEHPGPPRGEQIPHGVPDDVDVLAPDAHPFLAGKEEVRLGLGVQHGAAVQDNCVARQIQRRQRRLDVRTPPGGGDPEEHAVRVEPAQQLAGAGQRTANGKERFVDLAVSPLHSRLLVGRQRPPDLASEGAGGEAAAHADATVDEPAGDFQADFGERLLESQNVGVDGIHQGAVEVEYEGAHGRKYGTPASAKAAADQAALGRMSDPPACVTIEVSKTGPAADRESAFTGEVTMEYRALGASGLKVSPICLGTMLFGSHTDQAEAARIVGSARDAGINFIDTAVSYAGGKGEAILGDLLASDRDWWIVATKVGSHTGDGPNEDGTSRRQIQASIERSLRRLRTDHIDLYYLHRDDPTTPLRESLQAVGDLIRSGKVLYLGLSNFRAWRLTEAVGICRELGIPTPIALQPYYHALNRQPEVEVLPAAAHFGLGVVPYSPLARGVLTGKYRPGEEPAPDTRAGRKDFELMTREWRDDSLRIAQEIRAYAESRGMTSGQFAVNWLLSNALVTAVLAGPRTLEQWTEYLGALEHGFDANDAALIDRLVPPGHASSFGYTDPTYPVTGRVPRELKP